MNFTEKQQKSLERVKRALDITSGDTLSRINMENKVIWTASGSWNGSQKITIGDVVNLVNLIESLSSSKGD
jgi:hypothetical protein